MTIDQILASITVAQPSRELAPWDNFVAQHPARAGWIDRNPGFDFAASLRRQIEAGRQLSDKQLAAIDRCLARDRNHPKQDAPRENLGTLIHEALAVSGLRWPALRVFELVFKPAPAAGQNAGAVYITRRDGGAYLGKIDAQGAFWPTGDATTEDRGVIKMVALDPAAAAKASGLQTGRCSCCGLELTNPESIELGIGPICREKWGW